MSRFASRVFASFLVVATVMLTGTPARSQGDGYRQAVERIRDEGFNRSQVMEYAWHLTDVIGPRLSGSTNMRESQEWARDTMEQIGLSNAVIEPWGEHGVNWDIEYVSLHMLEPDYQPLIGWPQGFTVGTEGKVTGRVVVADIRSRADLEGYRGRLQDAFVLSTPARQYGPRFEPQAIRHDQGSLEVFVEEGVDRNIALRRQEEWARNPPGLEDLSAGELEAFFKSEGVAVVLVASQGGDGTVFVTGRRDRSPASVRNSLPTLYIAAEHYGRMYRLAAGNVEVTMEAEVRIRIEERDSQEYNVIGEIPGSDLAHEIVMLGAHLDSWHTGTGATDNASGSAVVLEAMRILKATGAAPRRTIKVGLWSAEEGGLRGSRAYVAQNFGNPRDGTTADYDNFSVYFNMDNGTGRIRGIHQQGNQFVAPIFAAWLMPFDDLKVGTLSNFSNRGSDQLSFDEAGLPGFQILQDRIEYRTRTHHTNMDVFDKLIAEDLQINAVVLASLAYQAAMVDERLPRKPFTDWRPQFELAQEDLFGAPNTYTNAIADYDNDGDLDIFVGFNGQPNRLYRNDGGRFTDVAVSAGVADSDVTRAAAWGDYNGDGHLDLFVGFVSRQGSSNRLYENGGDGSFTDVTAAAGIGITGSFRQVSWVDYDNDGDVDLFLGLRDKPNVLFRNDGGRFTDVAAAMGVDDPRHTVGAAWADFDQDGDLDLVVANMDGDANGLFRNDGVRFVDIAVQAGIDHGGRALGCPSYGSVRPTLADFDNDGNIDIFMANYGPNALFRNLGDGSFENVAARMGVAIDSRYDTATWGDYDNDGRLDLYVNGTVGGGRNYRDYLFHNDGDRFTDVTPPVVGDQQSDHGAHWADMDGDGDLDLLLTGGSPAGMHHLLINSQADERARRSLQVLVLDADGHYTRAGAEVRLFDAASGALLGTGIVDTGSGYNSQNAMPVHFGLASEALVDVEVTTMTRSGRKSARLSGIDPSAYVGRWLVVKVDESGGLRQ